MLSHSSYRCLIRKLNETQSKFDLDYFDYVNVGGKEHPTYPPCWLSLFIAFVIDEGEITITLSISCLKGPSTISKAYRAALSVKFIVFFMGVREFIVPFQGWESLLYHFKGGWGFKSLHEVIINYSLYLKCILDVYHSYGVLSIGETVHGYKSTCTSINKTYLPIESCNYHHESISRAFSQARYDY